MRGLGIALLALGILMLAVPAAVLIWAWTMYSVGVSLRLLSLAGLWILIGVAASVSGLVILSRGR